MAETPLNNASAARMILRRDAILLLGMAFAPPACAQPNPLATPDQRALDRQAMQVFASPVVQAQLGVATRAFSADPYAQTTEGKATLPQAAREVVFAAVQSSIDRDPAQPLRSWGLGSPDLSGVQGQSRRPCLPCANVNAG